MMIARTVRVISILQYRIWVRVDIPQWMVNDSANAQQTQVTTGKEG